MKLNVLFYSDAASNPRNLPLDWPAEVREVPNNAPAPTPPWVEMTVQEYNDYRAARIGSIPEKTAEELAEEAEAAADAAERAAVKELLDDIATDIDESQVDQDSAEAYINIPPPGPTNAERNAYVLTIAKHLKSIEQRFRRGARATKSLIKSH